MNPLVSIISPIYGVEKYIEECLESMFNQTYKNIEFVFVNDKTPDNSMMILEQVIKKYGIKNVNIINHEHNLGLCGVRNTGLKAAKGDYIMIVDSDDKLPLDSVETLVNCAISNDADFVESDFAYYPGYVGETFKRVYDGNKEKYLAGFISMRVPPAIWGKLYSRALFQDIDSLFKVGRDNVEDAYSTPILADSAQNIAYTNKVTYYYRIDNPSSYSTTSLVGWNKVDDMIYCVTEHEVYFKKNNSLLISNAIQEKKCWIINKYFLRLKEPNDRKRLIKLFPDIRGYIKKKPYKERLCWFLLSHDSVFMYKLVKKLFFK